MLDGLPVQGLALGGYTLFPLWVWIYCIIWWIIQVGATAPYLKLHRNCIAIAPQ